jgi:hypothetical protein
MTGSLAFCSSLLTAAKTREPPTITVSAPRNVRLGTFEFVVMATLLGCLDCSFEGAA